MAKPSRATQKKRERERNRMERQADKREERAMRKEERKKDDGSPDDGIYEDPDLIGIVPGPQPRMDE
jgi:hypothetical protein